jgi:mannose-6-phosphate isomerase-like protein (cupin superfamily)
MERILVIILLILMMPSIALGQTSSSHADTSAQERRKYGLFGTGMLPDSVFFAHPPKLPFSAGDYVFTFDQAQYNHRTPGEFVWFFIGERYGFESLWVAITETHPGRGTRSFHALPSERVFVLLEGTAQYLIGDSTFTVQAPSIVKIPAGVPHTFLNVGRDPINFVTVTALQPGISGGSKNLGPNPLRPPVDESRLPPDQSVSLRAPRAAITVDGSAADWAGLRADVLPITCGAGKLAAEIRYAWDQDHLYILIRETPGDTTREEAENAAGYLDTPSGYDGVSFFLDVDNWNAPYSIYDNAPLYIEDDNADFNPWFGFSSTSRSDLFCARSNKYWTHLAGPDAYRTYAYGNQEMLKHSAVATSGSQSGHSRVIEAAIRWSDIEAGVDAKRLRGGFPAIRSGLRIGCEPLLIDDGTGNQRFLNGDRTARPNGRDAHSRDIVLTE